MTTIVVSPSIDPLSRSPATGQLLAFTLIPALTFLVLLITKEVIGTNPDHSLAQAARAWDIGLVPLGFTVIWIVGAAVSQVLK